MAYIGIGYNGPDEAFLPTLVEENRDWLDGERVPKFYGNGFLVLYDSNTSREFVRTCTQSAAPHTLSIYTMSRPFDAMGGQP